MKSNVVETVVGAIVLAIALVLLSYAYLYTHRAGHRGYPIVAQFDHIDGVTTGSDVRLAGIKVGHVEAVHLDPVTYMAKVTMILNPEVKLPKDSEARITSDSLLGGKHLALVPGGEDDMLKAGEMLTHTQSSMNLESLIGQMIFQGGGQKKGHEGVAASGSTLTSAGASPAPTSAAG